MYHVLLTNRYLTTRVIPVIAVAAVALCVTLVVVVVSVMTGFLDMVKNSGRTLMGDVVVSYRVTGLPHYERLIERIQGLPEAAAATPVVDGWGLLKMPYPDGTHKETHTVQFWAVEPESFAAVTEFARTLYWRPATAETERKMGENDFRRRLADTLGPEAMTRLLDEGLTLRHEIPDGRVLHGIVPGMHISIGNERQKDGTYTPALNGYWWMPRFPVVLTTLPVDTAVVAPAPESAPLHVVNEFVSGVFLIDDTRVIIPLALGQELLHLDEKRLTDEEGEETGLVDPPRATMVLVRAADGVDPAALRARVSRVYDEYRDELRADPAVPDELLPPFEGLGVTVHTWLQQQRKFIAPIEKERELMRVLFSIVYLVCAGLVLSIFWAIVYEKTRDIGILRSIGASRAGISFIFLRYGAIIGMVGSILGLGLAYLIVHNINAIHDAMGEPAPRWVWTAVFVLAGAALLRTLIVITRGHVLPVVLWALTTLVLAGLATGLMLHRGTLVWDPSVYYFSRIPNQMDLITAITTVIGAVVFSVLGAFIPAAKAADTDPVRALRYE